MKHIIQTLGLGMILTMLSSCDTYVEGRGHARTNSSRPHYDSKPARQSSGPLINANTNLGVRL